MSDALTKVVEQVAEPFWSEIHDGHVAYQESLLEAYRKDADLGDGTFKRPGQVYKGRRSEAAHVLARIEAAKAKGAS